MNAPHPRPDRADDLQLAFRLADEADALTVHRFRALDLVVETKPDLTPVSDADRAVEEALRTTLARERPTDAVLGEEFGVSGQADRQWVLDPIDGTKNFVRGVPVWASLIGLLDAGEIVVGVVSAPALGMRWWAARGQGAWSGHGLNAARRLQVSAVASVADASVSFSEITDPAWAATGSTAGFHRLLDRSWRSRAYGDFWSHMLVAEGAVDVAVEPQLGTWDMAALVPIVEEAGGRITALDGSSPLAGGNAVSTNGRLHDDVLAMLSGPASDDG
ncbi:MAG: histidinol-phosphatase [Actinomycetes bacterium]